MINRILTGLALGLVLASSALAAPKAADHAAVKAKSACCDLPCCTAAKGGAMKKAKAVAKAASARKSGACCGMPCCDGGGCCGDAACCG